MKQPEAEQPSNHPAFVAGPADAPIHGRTCEKKPHDKPGGGYLHGEDDDTPYDVDGWRYCGRCHFVLEGK